MLVIAVVGNSFQHCQRFVEYKFKDKIEKVQRTTGTYTLKNGDQLELCYSEQDRDRYKSVVYDAFIIVPEYESLLDTIIHRTMRPFH